MRKLWQLAVGVPVLLGSSVPFAICQQATVLVGTGSTVPAPLVIKWADAYNHKDHAVKIRYLATGISEGITDISHGSGDFAVGELPLTPKQRADGSLIEVPAVVIGIVPIYNLPRLQRELRFTGEVLAEIFLGDIKTWNSPALAKLNPGVTLPDLPINLINRPAGIGSNYIFTEYLSKVSSKFRKKVGVSASPKWRVGTPAEGSSEMVDAVKSQVGAIGYVEAQYAIQSRMPFGVVQNASGSFIKASRQSLTAACRAVEAPGFDNFSASLTNAPGVDSFPITSFDWLYLRTSESDPRRAAGLNRFLAWVFSDGQRLAAESGYAELPPALAQKIKARVATMR